MAAAASPSDAADPAKHLTKQRIAATVNDQPILMADVQLLLKGRAPAAEGQPSLEAAVLATIIREELLAQKAVALGLDRDPQLLEELDGLQARVNAVKRRRLAEKTVQREVTAKIVASEAETRKYFEANQERIHTELHVWQLMMRDEKEATAALAEMRAGAPFEEVAKKHLASLPAGQKPWDLGFLMWKQIPPPWQDVIYKLDIGKPSEVIRGAANRFWIVQVMEKQKNTKTFEDVQAVLGEDMKAGAIAARRAELEKELMDSARIVRTTQP